MYKYVVLLHVLGATVWAGGHLVLAFTVLPRSLRQHSVDVLLDFESGFEKIGMPALLVQIVTGLWMAFQVAPDLSTLLAMNDLSSKLIMAKLALLIMTVMLAVDARFRVIPNMTAKDLVSMAWHIVPVTILSVLFVVVGVSFRVGGFP